MCIGLKKMFWVGRIPLLFTWNSTQWATTLLTSCTQTQKKHLKKEEKEVLLRCIFAIFQSFPGTTYFEFPSLIFHWFTLKILSSTKVLNCFMCEFIVLPYKLYLLFYLTRNIYLCLSRFDIFSVFQLEPATEWENSFATHKISTYPKIQRVLPH